jgi:hypothetical protein
VSKLVLSVCPRYRIWHEAAEAHCSCPSHHTRHPEVLHAAVTNRGFEVRRASSSQPNEPHCNAGGAAGRRLVGLIFGSPANESPEAIHGLALARFPRLSCTDPVCELTLGWSRSARHRVGAVRHAVVLVGIACDCSECTRLFGLRLFVVVERFFPREVSRDKRPW